MIVILTNSWRGWKRERSRASASVRRLFLLPKWMFEAEQISERCRCRRGDSLSGAGAVAVTLLLIGEVLRVPVQRGQLVGQPQLHQLHKLCKASPFEGPASLEKQHGEEVRDRPPAPLRWQETSEGTEETRGRRSLGPLTGKSTAVGRLCLEE